MVSGNEAERLLSDLNLLEPSIQFTPERDKDRHFPFLDLNVSRGVQGNLETSVYRKSTHTNKYLAFNSHHPICHKKSVAKTLLRRVEYLPSSLDSKAEERKHVSNVLKANCYTKVPPAPLFGSLAYYLRPRILVFDIFLYLSKTGNGYFKFSRTIGKSLFTRCSHSDFMTQVFTLSRVSHAIFIWRDFKKTDLVL